MTRRQLTADQAFSLLKRHSQNTHVKLRTIAQTVIQTGDLPVGRENAADDTAPMSAEPREHPQAPLPIAPPIGRRRTRAPETAMTPTSYSAAFGAGQGCGHLHLRFRNPT